MKKCRIKSNSPINVKPLQRRAHFYLSAIAAAAVIISAVYLYFDFLNYTKLTRESALTLSDSLSAMLHPEHISKLSGDAGDFEKPEYNLARQSLVNMVEKSSLISYACLLAKKDGEVVYLLDSSPEDSGCATQRCADKNGYYSGAFEKAVSFLTPVITEDGEKFISSLSPIQRSSEDGIITVLRLDFPLEKLNADIWRYFYPDALLALCLVVLIYALGRYLIQHWSLKKISKKLSFDEALYRGVYEKAPIGIAIVSDKKFVYESDCGAININAKFESILGRTGKELAQIEWPKLSHPDDLEEDLKKFNEFKSGKNNGYSMEKRFIRPDGSYVWVNMTVSPFLDRDYDSPHLCLIEDITPRKTAESMLSESERSKSVLFSHLPGMAYRCKYDRDWTMLFVSDGCFGLTGYKPEDLINNRTLSFNELIVPEYRAALWGEWEDILLKKTTFKNEYEIIAADGLRKWVLEMGQGVYDENGNVAALEGIILDITDLKEAEKRLKYNAEHDIRTGLFNRKKLLSELQRDLESGNSPKLALIEINLSPAQGLSLLYGSSYSDEVAVKIGNSLSMYSSPDCELYTAQEFRFVFYLKCYADKDALVGFCEKIASLIEPILVSERIGAGIGVAEVNGTKGISAKEILKNVLIASERALSLYEKSVGLCFFGDEMARQVKREETIITDLTKVINGENKDSLYLHFQPIYNLKTKRIAAFEALGRLDSPSLGEVPPVEFIPLAEKNRLINPLGDIIIEKALDFLKTLGDSGYKHISVTINISALQFLQGGFEEKLRAAIQKAGVSPRNVGLEFTESFFASNYQDINNVLGNLKKQGVKIAIDDFGTGYSSLARERELNVDCLKIDRYFIKKLLSIPRDRAMTGDIISMAHRLGHFVVAEGVEREEQLRYLESVDCDEVQGYFISKPLGATEALEFLKSSPVITPAAEDILTPKPRLLETEGDLDQLRLILDSTAEAIYGINLDGECTYCNNSCTKLLGYDSKEEILGKNMHETIHHTRRYGSPFSVEECKIHKAMWQGKGFEASDEVFWRADGSFFDAEYHSYPQIKNGLVVGAVISFKDITEQKKKESEIHYQSYHDTLTGLYNRRSFEKSSSELDKAEKLPISLIYADINGLKMTNDIFGHAVGDKLIIKAAEVLTLACKGDGVVARVGGDEFMVILPQTEKKSAEIVLSRIRSNFQNAKVAAIKCSISLGCDTKKHPEQSLAEVMTNAENAMYKDKTMNRKAVNKDMLQTIIDTLHARSARERQHSIIVSQICGELGGALGLPETEISKLKRAGYMHDIGKIIVDEETLLKFSLSEEETEKMRQHSMVGYRILNLFDDTLDLAEYIYGHHEKWDGSGYPRGLKGEQIPLIARIISVVEVYERELAKSGLPPKKGKEAALGVIAKNAGTRFDPSLAKIFIELMESGAIGAPDEMLR